MHEVMQWPYINVITVLQTDEHFQPSIHASGVSGSASRCLCCVRRSGLTFASSTAAHLSKRFKQAVCFDFNKDGSGIFLFISMLTWNIFYRNWIITCWCTDPKTFIYDVPGRYAVFYVIYHIMQRHHLLYLTLVMGFAKQYVLEKVLA